MTAITKCTGKYLIILFMLGLISIAFFNKKQISRRIFKYLSSIGAPNEIKEKLNRSKWSDRHYDKVHSDHIREAKLILIGNSIIEQLESMTEIWQSYYAPYKTHNLGFAGDRVDHIIWRLRNGELKKTNAKLVVLLAGTNDTLHNKTPAEQTAKKIRDLIKTVKHQLPDANILLLAILPCGNNANDQNRIINDKINLLLPRIALEEEIDFLNVNHVFLEDDMKLKKDLMPDSLHPSEKGSELWFLAMKETIEKLMH